MFSRRSPAVKDKNHNTQFNNDNHTQGIGPSPSRDGSSKGKRKLSCMERSRLCLLRSRGSPIWLCVFVAGAILCALQEMNKGPDFFASQLQRSSINRYWHSNDPAIVPGDRILFQPIELQKEGSRQDITGQSLFQRANYAAKPLMVGFLLVPDPDKMKANYFLVHHPTSDKMKRLTAPKSEDGKPIREEFQTIRIDYHNHGKFEYLIPKKLDRQMDVSWKFKTTQVEALGLGQERQDDIRLNSEDYERQKPDDPPDNCVPQYDWQLTSFPNCNEVHQVDILTRIRTLNPAEEPESILLARGGYRDVWMVEQNDLPPDDPGETLAMKTLLYEHPFSERNMDRHRKDAVATDRLRKSPNALNLFAYCSNTGIYEFAAGGSLEDAVDDTTKWKKWTPQIKMKYAYQVAKAIADVHNIDKEGVPSMAHTDISMSQFVSTDNGKTYLINDFNRARFLFVKENDPNEVCTFTVASNKGKFRAPEEYAYKGESAKIDVYSMGNIFYVLLTGTYPFAEVSKKDTKELILKGNKPELAEEYLKSDDDFEQALVTAMKMCWHFSPERRATSREVEQFLRIFNDKLQSENAKEV